jgi:hypothetical protein
VENKSKKDEKTENQKRESGREKRKGDFQHRGSKIVDTCVEMEVVPRLGGVLPNGHWEFPDGVWKKHVRKKKKKRQWATRTGRRATASGHIFF